MAAFNWFKRSYQEPEESKPKESKPKESIESEDQKQPVEEKQEETPASSEDYLNWAKAAYQNIQSRQAQSETQSAEAEQTQEPEASKEETSEDESTQDESSREIASEDEAPPVEAAVTAEASMPADVLDPVGETESDVEEVDTEPGSTEATETDISETDTPVVAASDTTSTAATSAEDADAEAAEVEPEGEPLQVRPFWAAQAEQERIARLERLQAEAILEPEPEPEPTTPEQTVPLDIDLDEAFLWSAEVLASQGRRPDQISVEEITWLNKLRQGLDKTRRGLVNQLKSIVGQGPLNDEAVDEIEALLLQADVGVAATDKIISALQSKLREETLPPEQAIDYLKSLLRDMLEAPLEGKHNLTFTPEKDKLSIWLMTGVNGAGKTTTIGKLAHIATKSEFKCLIGAADTFRAAAVEQVKVWGDRSGVEVIANPGKNTDPAAVVFDAISAANSRDIELLLIDTAGRLQNKKNLMDELSKVRKIIDKKAPDANIESLLVLDATLGQNGLRQAQVFAEAAQLSGVVLTKLDGTARGGVALAVVEQLGLPIRFIGAGEGIEDLRPFSSYEFIEALLSG